MVIKEKIYIHRKMHLLWKSLVSKENMKLWWKRNLDFSLEEGAEIMEKEGEHKVRGYIVSLNKGKEFSFSWKEDEWPEDTLITFKLYPEPAGTIILLNHVGWEKFPDGERENFVINMRKYWKEVMGSFKKNMEIAAG